MCSRATVTPPGKQDRPADHRQRGLAMAFAHLSPFVLAAGAHVCIPGSTGGHVGEAPCARGGREFIVHAAQAEFEELVGVLLWAPELAGCQAEDVWRRCRDGLTRCARPPSRKTHGQAKTR